MYHFRLSPKLASANEALGLANIYIHWVFACSKLKQLLLPQREHMASQHRMHVFSA